MSPQTVTVDLLSASRCPSGPGGTCYLAEFFLCPKWQQDILLNNGDTCKTLIKSMLHYQYKGQWCLFYLFEMTQQYVSKRPSSLKSNTCSPGNFSHGYGLRSSQGVRTDSQTIYPTMTLLVIFPWQFTEITLPPLDFIFHSVNANMVFSLLTSNRSWKNNTHTQKGKNNTTVWVDSKK